MAPVSIENVRVDDENAEMHFDLLGADDAFANLIRSSLITRVHIPAVTQVVIHKNTSVFPEDMIAHRLGMLPVTGWDSLGIEGIEAQLVLSVKAEDERLFVTGGMCRSELHKNVRCVNSNDIILVLNPGEELSLTATVKLGTGKDHSRWNPSVAPRYRKVAEIRVDRSLLPTCPNELRRIARSCPRRVFDDEMNVVDPEAYDFVGDVIREAPPDSILISEAAHIHKFSFGTTGSIGPKDLLRQVLINLLLAFEKIPNTAEVVSEDGVKNMFAGRVGADA